MIKSNGPVVEHMLDTNNKMGFKKVQPRTTAKRLISETVEIDKKKNVNREEGYQLSNNVEEPATKDYISQ